MEDVRTVDDVQEQVDALLLSVFEAMRSISQDNADVKLMTSTVLEKYATAQAAVENLKGINRSQTDRAAALRDATKKLDGVRFRVTELEARLLNLRSDIDSRIVDQLQHSNPS